MKETEKSAYSKLLEAAEKEKFYGEIAFRYRDGVIFQIFKGESIKPEDLIKP